jgi:hypothetical protein
MQKYKKSFNEPHFFLKKIKQQAKIAHYYLHIGQKVYK